MKENFLNELPPEQKEKTKKGLVWILVFSIIMFFAGLTSAYIVSKGDNFWVKVAFPNAFWISTVVIFLSSLTMIGAVRMKKKGNQKGVRALLISTTVLGIAFGFFQFQGYATLVDNGAHFVSRIMVDDGRYGDYYSIKMDGVILNIDGNEYQKNGETLSTQDEDRLIRFANLFERGSTVDQNFNISEYGKGISLLYKDEPLALVDGKFMKVNGEPLKPLEYDRLVFLSTNIKDKRGDFFIAGKLGEDFDLYYKSTPLDYKDRKLYYKGQVLSNNLQNKLLRGNADNGTTYLYMITFLHLLHIIAGVIMLIVYTTRSFSVSSNKLDEISLKSGSVFWHFLGLLWAYLLLFLLFIH